MADNYDDPYADKPSNAERAAEIKLVKDPSMYKKTTDSKKKKLANFGDYMAKNESRGHKILATKLGNMERMRTHGTEVTPPFEPDPPKKNPSATAGKYGQGYSTARHLAQQGMNSVKEAEDLTALVKPSEDQTRYPKGDAKKSKSSTKESYCDSCDRTKRECVCDDVNEAKDPREYGYEGEMAITQLKTIGRHADNLLGMMKPDTDLPEWVQSKITLATDYMQTAHDYLMSEMNEAMDKEHPIYKEYLSLKKQDIKSLRDQIKRQHRIVDTSEFRTKEHAISHILNNKHGNKRVVAALGESVEQMNELSKGTLSSYASKANQDALYMRQDAGHTAGAERAELKLKAARREAGVKMADRKISKEDFDYWDTELAEIDEATSPMQKLRDAHDRHMEKALAANRAGDDVAVKVHQNYMQKLTAKMTKMKQMEAWNVGNRNNQRSIQVGHKVRSYDFPGMHDSHYIEGHVVSQTPSSYHIKVNKVVRDNKEVPIPAHMHHVEAPKGRSIWTDAVAVHKIHEAAETVVDEKGMKVANPALPVTGAARTFSGFKDKLKK
jgi:hypothetical protein